MPAELIAERRHHRLAPPSSRSTDASLPDAAGIRRHSRKSNHRGLHDLARVLELDVDWQRWLRGRA